MGRVYYGGAIGEYMIRDFLADVDGATTIEYVLLAGLLTILLISALSLLGTATSEILAP